MSTRNHWSGLLIMLALAFSGTVSAQADDPGRAVATRAADIISEGTRMSATVFTPPGAGDDEQLPSILMAHGWGGVAAQLRRDAMAFAREGYLVVTFDYRGWGGSDGRIIPAEALPPAEQRQGAPFTARVRELREIVDPVDMLADWQNALHWLHGEPQVDTDRIGLWGSSQSGGYVVEMAIREERVAAVHSQVGSLSGRGRAEAPEALPDATARARGELPWPEPGETVVGNLRGAPIDSRFANYEPARDINRAGRTPIQFVLAENEELFDNREHGILAHDNYEGPKNLVIIPGIMHYGVYRQAWQQANDLALEWFNRHL
jgi:dienelactone hydrolase